MSKEEKEKELKTLKDEMLNLYARAPKEVAIEMLIDIIGRDNMSSNSDKFLNWMGIKDTGILRRIINKYRRRV